MKKNKLKPSLKNYGLYIYIYNKNEILYNEIYSTIQIRLISFYLNLFLLLDSIFDYCYYCYYKWLNINNNVFK